MALSSHEQVVRPPGRSLSNGLRRNLHTEDFVVKFSAIEISQGCFGGRHMDFCKFDSDKWESCIKFRLPGFVKCGKY